MRTKEKIGFKYDPKEAIKPILHAQACVRAIESIGGDPERVTKMYEALKRVLDILQRRMDHLGPLPHTNKRELAEVESLLEIIEPLVDSALEGL